MAIAKRKTILVATASAATFFVMVAALIGLFDRPTPPKKAAIADYPIAGIDLSAHNGTVDFRKAKTAGIKFVILKASEGLSFTDPLFTQNYEAAKAEGLKVGAYHFFRFDVDGIRQAHHFINTIKTKSLSLPLIVDVESHTNPFFFFPSKVMRNLRDMIDELNAYNFPVMIYTNKDGYDQYIDGHFEECPLWICTFDRPSDSLTWQIWQYSHWGNISGINGDVDLNVFASDSSLWKQWTQVNERRISASIRLLPAIN